MAIVATARNLPNSRTSPVRRSRANRTMSLRTICQPAHSGADASFAMSRGLANLAESRASRGLALHRNSANVDCPIAPQLIAACASGLRYVSCKPLALQGRSDPG